MQRHTGSWYIRLIILVLIIFVGLPIVLPSSSTASGTVFKASIGAGTHHIHSTLSGSDCGTPVSNSIDFDSFGGTLFDVRGLNQSLLLLQQDSNWVAASFTTTATASIGFGSSTYTSTLSADGILTTMENGSPFNDFQHETVTTIETVDLNTGKYTYHRTIAHNDLAVCSTNSDGSYNYGSLTGREIQDHTLVPIGKNSSLNK